MKSNVTLFLIFFILFSLSFLTVNVSADPAVMVSSYSLYPEVLSPGDKAILTLTITNGESTATTTRAVSSTGSTSTLTNTTVKQNGAIIQNIWIAQDGDGIKDVKADKNYADFGLLAPGGSFTICFEIYAQENITDGNYFPKVVVDLETPGHEDLKFPVLVKVNSLEVELVKKEVPSKISVSGSTDVTFSVVNNRGGSVDSVKVTPRLDDSVDFVPGSVFVGAIDSDSSEDVTFSLQPSSSGVKTLFFDVSYKNGDNVHNSTLSLDLEVVDTLDVAPVIYSVPSNVVKGETTRLRIEVYNAKTEEITGVIVTPVTDAVVVPSQYFVGSMGPDDVFSVSFDVSTDDLVVGQQYPVSFKVSFKQGGNYYETPVVSSFFTVVEPQSVDDYNFIVVSLLIVFFVVVFLIFYFYYCKRRKK